MMDSLAIFSLRNSQEVRKVSQDSKMITRDSHDSWFYQRLLRLQVEPFFIGCIDSDVVGYVRYEMKFNNCFVVSIAISSNHRGLGLGTLMLQKSIKKIRDEFPDSELKAYIHEDNEVSIQLFSKVGFTPVKKNASFLEFKSQ